VDNALPKDDLYKKIEEQFSGKKGGTGGIGGKKRPDPMSLLPNTTKAPDEPVLPEIDVSKED